MSITADMLGVIRPNTYHANLLPLRSEFYDFCKKEDELAADLIAKSIRRLLQKAPVLLARQNELLEEQAQASSLPSSLSSTASDGSFARMFHSDTSLSSKCSLESCDSDSSTSSQTSKSGKKRRKIDRNTLVVLPNDMLNRLVRDTIRMSEGESNGIRGCQIQVVIRDSTSGAKATLGRINCDSKILPSCILCIYLVAKSSPSIGHGSQILLNRLLKSNKENTYIQPGYSIEKVKSRKNASRNS